jgi:hypothetical protein
MRYILGVFFVALFWNFGLHEFFPTLKKTWILFSECLSALTLLLNALVFFRRYRFSSLPYVFVTICYIIVQRPVYTSRFIEGPVHSGWVLALAIGKLFRGLLFYTLFFQPAVTDAPLQWSLARRTPVPQAAVGISPRLRELALAIAIGLLGHLLGTILARPLPWLFTSN